MESKGEVPNERREKLETLQNNFEKLLTSAQTLSDLLNEELPELPKDEEAQIGGVVLDAADDSSDQQLDPWGDDETKSFYVDLPDLRLFLPNYAPKLQPVQTDEPPITEEVLDMEIEPEQLEIEEPVEITTDEKSSTPEPAVPEEAAPAGTASASGTSSRQQFAVFLKNIVNCVNKELTDSAAIEFLLSLNTKNNRKKLTTALFGVKRYHAYRRLSPTLQMTFTYFDFCSYFQDSFGFASFFRAFSCHYKSRIARCCCRFGAEAEKRIQVSHCEKESNEH